MFLNLFVQLRIEQSHTNVGIEFMRNNKLNYMNNFQRSNSSAFFCLYVSHEYDCKCSARLSLSLSAVRHSSLECCEQKVR